MDHTRLAPGVMVAVLGLTVVGLVQVYVEVAPSLVDVRAADPGSVAMRQHLMDADYLVGGLALLLAAVSSVYLRDPLPAALVGIAVGGTAWWHHDVLASPNSHIL